MAAIDINVIAENLVELLTNSTNMSSVFYDIFLNPIEMDVTLFQYNDENELVEVTIPNRAKDRRIALTGVGSPEGSVSANAGTCYVDSASSIVYFKVSGSGNTGWVEALTSNAIEDIIAGFQPTIATSGTSVVLLDKNGTITSSANVGDIGANKDLSNLSAAGNELINSRASVDLSNLSIAGQEILDGKASVNLDNLSAEGLEKLQGISPSLNNLSDVGNAKFQYAPFSINNGTVDANGENATIQTTGGSSYEVDTFVIPVLSSNSSSYGTCSNYIGTTTNGWVEYVGTVWTMSLSADNYIPIGAVLDCTITSQNAYQRTSETNVRHRGIAGCKLTFTYTDNTTEVVYDNNSMFTYNGAGPLTQTFNIFGVSKVVKGVKVETYSSNVNGFNFGSWNNFTIKARYSVSSASTLIVHPCTITTADGKSRTFTGDDLIDCSSLTSNTYRIMKSYSDGSLSLTTALSIQSSTPVTPNNGDLWLDTSMYPLSFKKYDSGTSTWVVSDLVWIGDVIITPNGNISSVKNNYYNACPAMRYVVKKLETDSRWCIIYSDGYCEQGGDFLMGANTNIGNISFTKQFKDINYIPYASGICNQAGYSESCVCTFSNKTTSGIRINAAGVSSGGSLVGSAGNNALIVWMAKGYIK